MQHLHSILSLSWFYPRSTPIAEESWCCRMAVLFIWQSLVPWYPTHGVPLGTWVVQFENSRYHGAMPRLWVRKELGAGSCVGSEYLWDHEQVTRTSELGVSHVTWGLGSEQFSHTRFLKFLRALDGWGKAGTNAITSVTYWHFGLSGKIYIGQLNLTHCECINKNVWIKLTTEQDDF